MKRSELKRTGFINRSGFIRKRSRTNSRSNEDRPLVAEYRAANPLCELHQFPEVPGGRLGQEINHIFSTRKRWDLRSNIIHLSAEAHRWFHQHPIDGRVMCLFAKHLKGELDDNEIKQASGKHIAGWLAEKEPTLAWVRLYWELLKESFP